MIQATPKRYNLYLHRKDLKHLAKQEWEEISELLVLYQLQLEITAVIENTSYCKQRRSHKITTADLDNFANIKTVLRGALDPTTYNIYCPHELKSTPNLVTCVLPAFLAKFTDAGQIFKLINLATKCSPPNLPVPPKELEDGRISVVMETSPDLLAFLLQRKMRLSLVGRTIYFKVVADLQTDRELSANLSELSMS